MTVYAIDLTKKVLLIDSLMTYNCGVQMKNSKIFEISDAGLFAPIGSIYDSHVLAGMFTRQLAASGSIADMYGVHVIPGNYRLEASVIFCHHATLGFYQIEGHEGVYTVAPVLANYSCGGSGADIFLLELGKTLKRAHIDENEDDIVEHQAFIQAFNRAKMLDAKCGGATECVYVESENHFDHYAPSLYQNSDMTA